MVLLRARRHFTQLRNLAGQLIDITHSEVDFRFLRGGQQVQNGIRRTAHGNIQGHGVFKRRFAGDVARQRGCIILLVIALSQLNDAFPRVEEQLLTVGVCRQQRAVTRLGQTQRFGQAVHRVGGKHPRTGTTGRTGGTLDLLTLFVGDFWIRPLNHRIDKVEFDDFVRKLGFPGFHWATGDKNHRNIQAQGRHKHPRGDFVTVGNADHGIGAVRVNHVLNRVGDQFTGWQ